MRKLYALILGMVSLSAFSQSQHICGFDLVLEQLKKENPQYEQQRDAWYRQALMQYDQAYSKRGRVVQDTVYYEIPVVFHVVYKNASENLPDALIKSQLTALNLAFRRMNADTVNTRSIFKPVARDTRIQFVMATKDPQGNSTTGITRTSTTVQQFGNIQELSNDMKFSSSGGKDGWDPTKYLNIWICDLKDPTFGEVLYGFAYPPDGTPNWQNSTVAVNSPYSGVVLHYKIVGINNGLAGASYKQGKSGVHEVGHYLGLRHVWGDGQFGSGCNVDDGIYDTPNARNANSNCDTTRNSCIDASDDKPDMVENYMDYTSNPCQNMFTAGQAAIMHYVLNTFRTQLPYRKIETDTLPDLPEPVKTEVKIFPNPAGGSTINVKVSADAGQKFDIAVYDVIGNLIFARHAILNSNTEIPIDGIANGIFIVRVFNTDHSVDTRQLVLKTGLN